MTNLGDLLGNMADKLAQDNLNVGDVHLLNLKERYYSQGRRCCTQ